MAYAIDWKKAAKRERREQAKWEAAERDPQYSGKTLLVIQKTAAAHRVLAERYERAAND